MLTSVIYILLGVLPSIVWLSFYLRKDANPEPKDKVVKIFLAGCASALLAVLLENILLKYVFNNSVNNNVLEILCFFLFIALIEESLKYLVVKKGILKDPEFDEPIDLVIYMIISALGFAALENIFLFFSEDLEVFETLVVCVLRFLGATLLHALCSGIFGFFIAMSFYKEKRSISLFLTGFSISILLHTLYNFSIINMKQGSYFIAPTAILLSLAIFLNFGFKKLKKLKSICKIE